MIKNLYRKRLTALRRRSSDESGFSLMEVIVAIAIMGIVATAAAGLSFNGIATSTAEERQQVATTVANDTLEKIYGWQIAYNATVGGSNLYLGRGKVAVQNAFTAMAARPGVAQTNPMWDVSLGLSSTANANAALPIVNPDPSTSLLFTQNGTNYTVYSLIGSCYEQPAPANAATNDNCTALPGASPTALIRAIVIVKWMAGSKCKVNGCFYQASTILDPNSDIEWISH